MAITYTETPENFFEIESLMETKIEEKVTIFFSAKRVLFYDACSFQKHSGLPENERNILINYFKEREMVIFITRCIMMELASPQQRLTENQINFLREMKNSGIKIILLDEENIYEILSECFSTNEKINGYLRWAAGVAKSPISTITKTLKEDEKLASEVLEGKNLKSSDLCKRFFTAVRKNKEQDDNLGEELIVICVHILSQLPGMLNGKLCVLTDDKGTVGKISSVLRRTKPNYRGAEILLFSTPKLVQHMFQEHVRITEDEMVNLISQGVSGNIVVMGTTAFDLDVNEKISMTSRKLVQKIMEPHGISIIF